MRPYADISHNIWIGFWTNHSASDGSSTLTLTLPADWAFVMISALTIVVRKLQSTRLPALTVAVNLYWRKSLERTPVHMSSLHVNYAPGEGAFCAPAGSRPEKFAVPFEYVISEEILLSFLITSWDEG
jgi:hypothetical protein